MQFYIPVVDTLLNVDKYAKHVLLLNDSYCPLNLHSCWFVHAICDAHGNGLALHVANHGPCPATTAPPPTQATITTTATPSTTTKAPVTTNALNPIFANLFCLYVDGINCMKSGVDIVCGTNGVLYPNRFVVGAIGITIRNNRKHKLSYSSSVIIIVFLLNETTK